MLQIIDNLLDSTIRQSDNIMNNLRCIVRWNVMNFIYINYDLEF